MEKIQKLEAPPQERENTVNTEAAARVIKSGLVSHRVAALAASAPLLTRSPQGDNKEIKEKLSELIAREKAKVAAKESEKKRSSEEAAHNGRSQNGDKQAKRLKRNGSKKKK